MDLRGRVLALIWKGEFRPAVLTLVGGTLVAQALGVVASPILTRMYDPVDFGEFAAVVAVIALVTSVSSLAYPMAIPLPSSDSVAANLLTLSLLATLIVSAGFGLLLLVTDGALLATFGAGSLASSALLVTLSLVAASTLGTVKQWSVRTRSFRPLAATSLAQAAAVVTTQVVVGLSSATSLGLLLGNISGSGAGIAFLARSIWSQFADSLRTVSWQGIWHAAKRYRRFAILSTPSAFLNALGLRAPLLMLTAIYGPAIGGQYLLAERVVALPVTLLAGSVGQVFTGQAAPLARNNPAALRRIFVRTTLSLAGTAVGPTALAIVLAPLLFGTIFGDDWADAGVVVAILAPWYFAALVFNPTGSIIDILERQDLNLLREVARLVLLGIAALLMVSLELSSVEAVFVLSIAGTLVYGLYGAVSWWAIRAFLRKPGRVRAVQDEPLGGPDPPMRISD